MFAALLAGGMLIQAEPVSESRAREIAMKVLAAQPATKAASGDVKLIWNGEEAATKAASQPAFYVFGSDRGGFVIVAGDDNVQPILAISEENSFKVEGMPANVRAWMDYIKSYVRSATTRSPEVAQQWAQLTSTKAPVDSAGLTNKSYTSRTVQWNQTAPANGLAPTVTGESQAVSGCLPLAVAEIMTWHKWPNTAVGTAEAYDSEIHNTSGGLVGYWPIAALDLSKASNFSITEEQWTALKALYTYAEYEACSDPTILTKLSQLVYACGVLLQANFNDASHGGTGANTELVSEQFANHMKYNKGAYLDNLSNHTPREWNTILKGQVLTHPVLYCGRASIGEGNDVGHAYVLDGYAKYGGDDVFHFNFGWGGSCNGYYYAAYQDMRETRPYVFDLELEALLDFTPDRTGTSTAIRKLDFLCGTVEINSSPRTFNGIRTSTTIQKDVAAPLEIGLMYNPTSASYTGKIRVSLEGKDGTVKQPNVLQYEALTIASLPSSYIIFDEYEEGLTATITVDLEFGDKLAVYYTDNEAQTNYVKMTGPRDGTCVWELPVMPAAFIKTDAEYNVNDYFQFELMNNDYVYAGTVWKITAPDGTITSNLAQSTREFKLTQTGTYKIEAAVKATVGGALVETITTYITVK